MTIPHGGTTSPVTRVLGFLGVIGGLAFLAAFVVEIPPAWGGVRILLWQVGGIAVALAVYPRFVARSRRVALIATVPVVATTAAQVVWLLLSVGRPSPFAGDFGLAAFWISTAMVDGTVLFGVAVWRHRVVWPVAAVALAAGTLVGYLGIDRLRLTSGASPVLPEAVPLVGLAVAALAWAVLGLQLALPALDAWLDGRSGPVAPVTPAA